MFLASAEAVTAVWLRKGLGAISQDHSRQHKQCSYQHERPEVKEVTSFKYRGTTLQGWHLLSRNPHQDCLSSNGSHGQTKQDLAVQHHKLHKQVQLVQVSRHLHPPLWL